MKFRSYQILISCVQGGCEKLVIYIKLGLVLLVKCEMWDNSTQDQLYVFVLCGFVDLLCAFVLACLGACVPGRGSYGNSLLRGMAAYTYPPQTLLRRDLTGSLLLLLLSFSIFKMYSQEKQQLEMQAVYQTKGATLL